VTPRRWALVAAAIVASAYALGGEWESIHHGVTENHLLDATVGLSFFGAGIIAVDRKPRNVIGPLMIAYAVTWFLGNWGNLQTPLLVSLGFVGGDLGTPLLAHVALAYPSGRLRTTYERLTLVTTYAVGFGASLIVVLTWDPRAFGCGNCVDTAAPLPNEDLFHAASTASHRSAIVLAPMFFAAIVLRWRALSPAGRRELAPLWVATSMLVAVYLLGAFASSDDSDPFTYLLWEIRSVIEIAIPIVFVWGLLSTRLARSAVGDLVVELEHTAPGDDLDAALAKVLADPTLRVAYAIPDDPGWVDASGRPVALPEPVDGGSQAVTLIEADGQPLAALIHDAALESGLVRAVGAAAGMAVANERLRAEVRAQLEEVRASRQRIVEAGDRERRRVERDLHDGAQQRLVTLSLSLAMMSSRQQHDPEMERALAAASAELNQALRELRELARGIHPAALTEDGLRAAVESLIDRSPCSVTLTADLDHELPTAVAATAYFVVSEALTNVAKYADADAVSVVLRHRPGCLHVEVCDDGVGGAQPRDGSGIRGLQDRVAALGGTLTVDSASGAGTRVLAEIPVDE
jgi:signal transduction histidine kinase